MQLGVHLEVWSVSQVCTWNAKHYGDKCLSMGKNYICRHKATKIYIGLKLWGTPMFVDSCQTLHIKRPE